MEFIQSTNPEQKQTNIGIEETMTQQDVIWGIIGSEGVEEDVAAKILGGYIEDGYVIDNRDGTYTIAPELPSDNEELSEDCTTAA